VQRIVRWLTLTIAGSFLVTACGGGGGGSSPTTPVTPKPTSVAFADASALWIAQGTVVWPGAGSGHTFRVLSANNAGLSILSDGTISGADVNVDLGSLGAIPSTLAGRYPQLSGNIALTVPAATVSSIKTLLKSQLVVVELNGSSVVRATHLQLQGVLDDTYAAAATSLPLGAVFNAGVPTFRLWAPTAQTVSIIINGTTSPMTEDTSTGIWSYQGTAAMQNSATYNYVVKVYARTDGQTVRTYTTTDPYATGVDATNASANPSQHAVAIDLSSPATFPGDWSTQGSSPVARAADVVLYELHLRDFSANDASVPAEDRGKFLAFSHPSTVGMQHLAQLARAGVTHVHLLPVFDIASVPDTGCTTPSISNSDPVSQTPQSTVAATAATDCYNWGYDPRHFGVPTGAYSTDGSALERVRNFREMVVGLHNLGLGLVMDVVYNHMNSNYLDQIVPGYYYRLDGTGTITTTSCCSDTATEYAMVEKLMNDTLARWTADYRVDGYRFDVMQNIPLAAMQAAKATVDAAAQGRFVYVYGEGFPNSENFVQANIGHLNNTHIGAFNYWIRDAVRGGGPFDNGNSLITNQGFMSGLCYDVNATAGGSCTTAMQNNLVAAQNAIRVSMAGAVSAFPGAAGITFNGSPVAFATNPDENVNYIGCHDGQTVWDIAQYKHPTTLSTADRVRAHVVGLSTVLLGQGVPFLMAGDEILRSKAFSANSYNSGDWFNRIDWTLNTNYISAGMQTMGLPASDPNSPNWSVMTPYLQNPNVNPSFTDISLANAMVGELLAIRSSTSLFRLATAADIAQCVSFPDSAAQKNGLIVMRIDAVGADSRACGDQRYAHVVVLVNANKTSQTFTISSLVSAAMQLHPIQQRSADTTVLSASFDNASGTFSVPARTTAVFVQ
jgi:pullulanase/glycogen debranching enzyme